MKNLDSISEGIHELGRSRMYVHVYLWLDVVSHGQTLPGRVWPCETRLDESCICCEVLLPAAPMCSFVAHYPPSTVVGKVGI